MIGYQPVPCLARSRDRHRVRCSDCDFGNASLLVPLGTCGCRRSTGTVICNHVFSGRRIEDETITTDTSHLRFEYTERGSGGNRSIDCVAAGP